MSAAGADAVLAFSKGRLTVMKRWFNNWLAKSKLSEAARLELRAVGFLARAERLRKQAAEIQVD